MTRTCLWIPRLYTPDDESIEPKNAVLFRYNIVVLTDRLFLGLVISVTQRNGLR
jgi:hypothetical protein